GGGGKDRDHLQFDLHKLLGRRNGVGRVVAQPGGAADRSSQRADCDAGDATEGRSFADIGPGGSSAVGDRTVRRGESIRKRTAADVRESRGSAAAAYRYYAADGVSEAMAGRQMDAARHRGLRTDGDLRAAGRGGGQPRDAAAADLQHQPEYGRGREEG